MAAAVARGNEGRNRSNRSRSGMWQRMIRARRRRNFRRTQTTGCQQRTNLGTYKNAAALARATVAVGGRVAGSAERARTLQSPQLSGSDRRRAAGV